MHPLPLAQKLLAKLTFTHNGTNAEFKRD